MIKEHWTKCIKCGRPVEQQYETIGECEKCLYGFTLGWDK